MSDPLIIWAFVAAVVAVVITPGADMAIIVTSALSGGRRAGAAAVAGVASGGAAHIAFSALGLTALVAAHPGALAALSWAGAAYLIWLGVSFLRARHAPGFEHRVAPVSPAAAWRRAALTNLLNPKAYLFMLIVFPQFICRDCWPVWVQALVLGGLLLGIAIVIYTVIALAAAHVGRRVLADARTAVWINRAAGLLLALLGVGLALAQAIRFAGTPL